MPNWASCSLQADDGESFWAAVKEIALASDVSEADLDDGDIVRIDNFFSKFVPMPEELRGLHIGHAMIDGVRYKRWREVVGPDGETVSVPQTAEDEEALRLAFGHTDWYDWACANWGTKWDTDAHYDPASERVSFDTAWAPPRQFVIALSELFPEVTFVLAYAEGGMGYYGVDFIKDGFPSEGHESYYHDGGMYRQDVDWDEIGDSYDALTEPARVHVEDYGLGTGG